MAANELCYDKTLQRHNTPPRVPRFRPVGCAVTPVVHCSGRCVHVCVIYGGDISYLVHPLTCWPV